MNKNLKNFSINSRRKIKQEIINKLRLIGITEQGIEKPLPQSNLKEQYFKSGTKNPFKIEQDEILKRNKLVSVLNSYSEQIIKTNLTSIEDAYKKALTQLIEEATYTWFIRLIALRFLEVNDFLPDKIRIFPSSNSRNESEILSSLLESNIEINKNQKKKLKNLKRDNKNSELFQSLFLNICSRLSHDYPQLFNPKEEYFDLLFPFSNSNKNGVINDLINQISEEDFDLNRNGKVEILGWLYQFYNSEIKDQIYSNLKKNKKINKETLPIATQIFTPDWIVKYLVENSLGRIWINHKIANNSNLNEKDLAQSFKWNYFVPIEEQSEKVEKNLFKIRNSFKNLTPEEITFLDPAMGSGHIISYAFDLLMQIYLSEGYKEKDAVKLILEKNLYGLEIDKKATQIAQFSILLKARQYDKNILNRNINLNLCEIPESNSVELGSLKNLFKKANTKNYSILKELIAKFKNAKIPGSLIKLKDENWTKLIEKIQLNNIPNSQCEELLLNLLKVAQILSKKFNCVVTNPPYLGSRYFNSYLKRYLTQNYKISHKDLFSAFIERNLEFLSKNGYLSMIIEPSLISLSSYEEIRKLLLSHCTIQNLIHMGRGIFGIDFGSIAFELFNGNIEGFKGDYFRLNQSTFQFISLKHIEELFLKALKNKKIKFDYSTYVLNKTKDLEFTKRGNLLRYQRDQKDFSKIPGSPFAYWLNNNLITAFTNGDCLGNIADSKQGLATTDNKRFLRQWFEVDKSSIKFNSKDLEEARESELKWFPYNKGGEYRKWYGNNDYIVNWENDGKEIKELVLKKYPYLNNPGFVVKNTNYYFKPSFSWSLISSGSISFRYKPQGFIFDVGGMSLFSDENLLYLGGLGNSKISKILLEVLNPTINYQAGDIAKIPVIIDESKVQEVEDLVKENIKLSKADWDSFETSWDFKKHPLIRKTSTIELAYLDWEKEAEERFNKLKENEEELNRIFIDIYNMDSELSPEVEDKYVSVRKADREREIKSLLSYAVGCIFGRYSLDEEGLILAGGELEEERYKSFKPDIDGIIPILDQAYFSDDIMDLLIHWLKVVYGDKTLEENLDYIAESLGRGENKSSRDIIREYFLKSFITDHNKKYRKRPIYWLYDSGRNNGFKALIYQHRYNKDTTGRIAAVYLKRTIEVYSSEIDRLSRKSEELKETGDTKAKREARAIDKQIEKLRKQLTECRNFNEKVQHLANLRISIDLDEGVLVNHTKIQTDTNGEKLSILKSI